MLKLSYSSSQDLLNCEQKYCFKKVYCVEPDTDAVVDTRSLRFGSAFHKIHELSMHELGYYEDKMDEYLDATLKEYGFEGDRDTKFLLASCVLSSMLLWQQTRLRVIKCELKIENEYTIGYIDFIAMDPSNRDWWIGDLKTTGMPSAMLGMRLKADPQLALYSCFIPQIAAELDLDPLKFQGTLYRETTKPRTKVKKSDTVVSFARTALASSRMFVIHKTKMQLEAVTVHGMLHRRATELHNNAIPIRNYKACLDWNKPCEFYSRCYGLCATECAAQADEACMTISQDGGDIVVKATSLVQNEPAITQADIGWKGW